MTLESNRITLIVSKTIILSAVIPSIVDFVLTNRIAISTVRIMNAVISSTTVTHFKNGLVTLTAFISFDYVADPASKLNVSTFFVASIRHLSSI